MHGKTVKFTKHKMCVFIFYTTFTWNIYHSKNNWARCEHKYTHIFTWSRPSCYSCRILL